MKHIVWPYFDHLIPVAAAAPGGGGGGAGGALDDIDEAIMEKGTEVSGQSSSSTGTQIRSEFPETWLWADYVAE